MKFSIFIFLSQSLYSIISFLLIKSLHLSYVLFVCVSFISSSLCRLVLSCLALFCFVLSCLVFFLPTILFPSLPFAMLLSHIDGRALSFPWRDAQRIILLWNSKSKIIIRGIIVVPTRSKMLFSNIIFVGTAACSLQSVYYTTLRHCAKSPLFPSISSLSFSALHIHLPFPLWIW